MSLVGTATYSAQVFTYDQRHGEKQMIHTRMQVYGAPLPLAQQSSQALQMATPSDFISGHRCLMGWSFSSAYRSEPQVCLPHVLCHAFLVPDQVKTWSA